ncbi:MAG: Rrf2 family transcriptional regulator [Candidatus Chisholmbacteria bacterium]|nr:Rrf2 family transcriptional regulator [Candidatus Chisholmbacteria bacterium]
MGLRLSHKGDYGLVLMADLARRTGFVSLRTVAGEKKLPYKFVSQVAGELHRAGILESKEGLGGGYRLARNPKKILVREVLDALEGPVVAEECDHGDECGCGGACVHEVVTEKVAAGVSRALAMFTVADLIEDAQN